MIGDLAAAFHFPPAELWGMDAKELLFWHRQAARVNRPASER
ncbi:MAG: GpE family phage tail protein [Candidatus Accumulibacter sp.]|nr:GpE family phage tail protein [Accumulibacter sp.]